MKNLCGGLVEGSLVHKPWTVEQHQNIAAEPEC